MYFFSLWLLSRFSLWSLAVFLWCVLWWVQVWGVICVYSDLGLQRFLPICIDNFHLIGKFSTIISLNTLLPHSLASSLGTLGGGKKKKDLLLCPTHLFLLFSILLCLFVVQCNSIWICSINLSFSSPILSSAVPVYWVLNFRHHNFHWEFLFDSIYKMYEIKHIIFIWITILHLVYFT